MDTKNTQQLSIHKFIFLKKLMTKAEEYFHELTKEIPEAKLGKMFGALCIKAPNGKSGAMFWQDCIIVKLNTDELNDAMKLNGSRLFEPMPGRPMKEWIQISFEHKSKWKHYAIISFDAVKNLKK
jgi:hypothetical protein